MKIDEVEVVTNKYCQWPCLPCAVHMTLTDEVSVQAAFYKFSRCPYKNKLGVLLLLLMLKFGICPLRLCIGRDGNRKAFVENVPTTAHNQKQQPEGKLRRLNTHVNG